MNSRHGRNIAQPGKVIAILGAWMQSLPFVGLVITVIGIIQTFNQIAEDENGSASKLADGVSTAIAFTATGLGIGLLGMLFMCYSLMADKYRAHWFYKTLLTFSVLWLLIFPVGTILGVILLLYLQNHRTEFQSPATTA